MMAHRSSTSLVVFCVILLIRDFSDCCTDSELIHGCRVEKPASSTSGQFECLCGVGCHKEFPFKSRADCEASIKSGRSLALDPCLPLSPCQNRGECIQLRFGRYRCECTGTNHYGDHCEKVCPERMGSNAFGYQDNTFPLDCIVI